MVRILAAVASIAFFGLVSAQQPLQVLSPGGPNLWWVANSVNVLAWNCHEATQIQQFTVWINNANPQVFNGPEAILAQANNFDCSQTIDVNHSNQPAGTGYFIMLTDIVNATNVYATSQQFEIKRQGSGYPATTVGDTGPTSTGSNGNSSATNTATGAGSSQTGKNSASSLKISFVGLGAAVLSAFAGLVTA